MRPDFRFDICLVAARSSGSPNWARQASIRSPRPSCARKWRNASTVIDETVRHFQPEPSEAFRAAPSWPRHSSRIVVFQLFDPPQHFVRHPSPGEPSGPASVHARFMVMSIRVRHSCIVARMVHCRPHGPSAPEFPSSRGARTFNKRLELGPHDRRVNPLVENALREAAIGAGENVLAAHQVGQPNYPFGNERGMFHDVRCVTDDAGNEYAVPRAGSHAFQICHSCSWRGLAISSA